jgi:hypothetical protein
MKFNDVVNETLSRISPVKLYRGASKTDAGSSEVERPFGTEADFPKAFLDGDFEEVVKIIKKHTGDSGFRGRGLRSYSLNRDVAQHFTFGDKYTIQEMDIPVQNIVSSFRRLQYILNQPVEVKQQLLDQGLGFNVNRLSKYPYPATDPDTEQEILIYKK